LFRESGETKKKRDGEGESVTQKDGLSATFESEVNSEQENKVLGKI